MLSTYSSGPRYGIVCDALGPDWILFVRYRRVQPELVQLVEILVRQKQFWWHVGALEQIKEGHHDILQRLFGYGSAVGRDFDGALSQGR